MAEIQFDPKQKQILVEQIQDYFERELEQSIGEFDAEFLLDFFSEKVGAYYYNQGLYDAQAVFQSRLDSINDAIYEIEKPTDFLK